MSRYTLIPLSLVLLSVPAAEAVQLNPVADAHVDGNATSSNFGTANPMQIKNDGAGSFNRKSYLRFQIPTLSSNAFFENASLDLTFVNSGAGSGLTGTNAFSVFGLNDGDPGETWGENTITWSNAPANGPGGAGVTSAASLLGSFTLSGQTGAVSFSSANLDDFLNGSISDDLVTFMLVRDTTSSGGNYVHAITSREGGIGQAVLNAAIAVPEPSTAFLLTCCGLAMIRNRRRRSHDQ